LPADARQHLGGIDLVEADRARRPAIGKGEPVELVEQARPGLRREAHHGQCAQVRAPEPRLQPAGQILVGEDRVEMHRRFGDAHALTPRRDAGMQVGERLGIVEPLGLGHEAFDQREHAVGAIDEARQARAPIGALARVSLIEPSLGACGIVGRRQPEQRQEIPALEMRACFLELRAAFGVDETGRGVGEAALGIVVRGVALRLDEDRPAGAETPQRIVEACRDGDELGRRRWIEIGSAEACGALEGAVLVQDDAALDECRPGQEVGEALAAMAILGEVHHREPSRDQMLRVAQVTAHHVNKGGIALGGPDGSEMAGQPDRSADDPQAKSKPNGGGQRSVDDRHRAWRAAEQDRFGQCTVDGGIEAGDGLLVLHQTSAPPPNWKNERKKLDAAKAIDRPKTIWIRRRKPPEVSPNASVRPVMMMTITEMTLATGPWIDSKI
jgi:hypothetical protein